MRQELFQGTLRTAKAIGLFSLARLLTSSGLRILCYHGFALGDENRFRSKLFVREEFFRSRMQLLIKSHFVVLPLEEAVEKLKSGSLPRGAAVITMDDGWLGVRTRALPVIKELNIPATLYVVTEYIAHPMPVFSVTVSYLFWKSVLTEVTLPRGLGHVRRGEPGVFERVIDCGLLLELADRFAFLRELAEALNVDFKSIEDERLFQMLSDADVRDLAEAGIDIQLHTHHHEWPIEDRTKADEEILLNRSYLARLVSNPLVHFCYPSGVYHERQIPWLKEMGIVTATTLLPGLNFRRTSPYELRRILDGESVSEIEFEAEMSGFMELIRRGRSLLWTLFGREAPAWQDDFEDFGIKQSSAAPSGNGDEDRKMGREEDAAFYDHLHAAEGTYDAPLERSIYSKLYHTVIEEVKARNPSRILEVGCGSGSIAKLIQEYTRADYHGFDFSAVAVEKARSRTGAPDAFFVGNALSPEVYRQTDYDGIVCTEVLEHIEDDLGVITNWRSGAHCICSVPNFDYEGHVRCFSNEEGVRARYSSLIEISKIRRVARPIKSDVNWREYFQRVRWMRENPRRMVGYLGIQTFERVGGWFVFSGLRK